MRLLHTTKFTLESFVEARHAATPKYAILSHTWEEGEVLFEDIIKPENVNAVAKKKAGWAKVQRSCETAKAEGYDYIWIDTLCIDKSSSAELSEAINSMFEWYALSVLCIAYIADYDSSDLLAATHHDAGDRDMSGFLESRWFTRGWTLQELIAPADLRFYDQSWRLFGSRTSFANAIETKTSIYYSILSRPPSTSSLENLKYLKWTLSAVCIAAKMGWVAERQTTRSEDIAYCMLGLFDVNMPLLYGEGSVNAFVRLQEDIIQRSFDPTILCWQYFEGDELVQHGRWNFVLAPSPGNFVASERVELLSNETRYLSAYGAVHPDGLAFEATLYPVDDADIGRLRAKSMPPGSCYLAVLKCGMGGDYTRRPSLLLWKPFQGRIAKGDHNPSRYFRAHPSWFVVAMGAEYLEIEFVYFKLGVEQSHQAVMEQVILCSPPVGRQIRQLVSGTSRPYVYKWWANNAADWLMTDLLECKPASNLEPWLPAWDKEEGANVVLSDSASRRMFKVNGIALFEHLCDDDAFLLLWGALPFVEGDRHEPQNDYFCLVVDWEQFTGAPYAKLDAACLVGECGDVALGKKESPFLDGLLILCKRVVARQRLSGEHQVTTGAKKEITISARVTGARFLAVDGLVIEVQINDRRHEGAQKDSHWEKVRKLS